MLRPSTRPRGSARHRVPKLLQTLHRNTSYGTLLNYRLAELRRRCRILAERPYYWKTEIMLMLSTVGGAGGGSGALTSSPMPPGQTIEVESCGGGGHGSARDNYIRLLVYVHSVDFGDCLYKPS